MRPEQRAGLVAVLAGTVALAVAWIAEHGLAMAPCALCLLERWPYRVLILLGVATLLASALAPPRAARGLLLCCALPLAAALALSLTHLGVEQGWWPDPWPACMAPHFRAGTMAQRLAAMPLRPAKPCDSPNRLFAFLPLSMSSLDLIYAALASLSIGIAARSRRAS